MIYFVITMLIIIYLSLNKKNDKENDNDLKLEFKDYDLSNIKEFNKKNDIFNVNQSVKNTNSIKDAK